MTQDLTIPIWRVQILNIGSAGMAIIATLTAATSLLNETLFQSTVNVASASITIALLSTVAIWRSGPYYLRSIIFIAINLVSIVTFLSWIGFTAAPALAGLIPILLAGLLLGTRWAIATWVMSIVILFSAVLGINQGIIPTTFDPALLNPRDLSFGIRYTLTFATFSVLVAVGTTLLIERLNQSLESSRQAQQQKENSQAQWTSLVDNAPDLILIVDRNHVIDFRNRPLLGFTVDQVVGAKVEEFLSPANAKEIHQAIEDVFETGEVRHFEISIRRADDSSAILATRVSPITGEDGVSKVTIISSDVTQQKALEQQLQQAQKVEAIGQLAAGVAHDFNNILMIIRGHADLIALKAESIEEIVEDTQAILNSAERGGRLTGQLLAYSRMNPQRAEPVALCTATENIIEVLQRLVGARYKITLDFSDVSAAVDCDQSTFDQVLTNLIINARDAMPAGGTIVIGHKVTNVSGSEASTLGLKPGNYVSVSVSDSGEGIDESTLSRIFEPFFTTKPVGSGTGLGLSMAYGSVRNWGGTFNVTTEAGVGSCMEMLLPLSTSSAPKVDLQSNTETKTPSKALTVLLVEDDRGVREVLQESLARNDFHVISASDGEEALQLFQAAEHKIDVVLSDVSMPKMTGTELAQALRASHPNLPMLLMSGYPLAASAAVPGVELISKPIAREALIEKLRELKGS